MGVFRQRNHIFSAAIFLGLTGWFAPNCSYADAGDDQYAVAASHYAAGRWQLAVDEFALLAKQHPQHRRVTDSLFFSGEAFMQLRSYSEAAKRFDQLLDKEPAHRYARQAMFRRGEAAHLAGDAAAADKYLTAFLGHFEKDDLAAYALPYLAATKLKLGARGDAATLFEQSVERHPQGPLSAESWLRLGVLRYDQGKFDEAVAALLGFDENHPKGNSSGGGLGVQVKYWRGMVCLAQGDRDPAAQHFNAALVAEPQGDWADDCLFGMLRVLAAGDDGDAFQRALADFRTRFSDSPLGEDLFALELRFWQSQKDYTRVIDLIESRLNEDDETEQTEVVQFKFQLAMACAAVNQQDKALTHLKEVLSSATGAMQADSLVTMSAIYVDRGQYEEAVEPLREYLAAHSEGKHAARCLGQLAICSVKLDDREGAKSHYDQLAQKFAEDPLFLATTLELAESSLHSGDTEWATSLFEELAKEENPQKYVARGIAGLAWCECLGQDLKASAATFERLLNEYPDDPLAAEAALARGQLLHKMGRLESALKTYQVVTTRFPSHKRVARAQLRSAQLLAKLDRTDQAMAAYQRLIDAREAGQAEEGSGQPAKGAGEVAEARYDLAWLHLKREDSAAAIEQFQQLHDEHHESRYWADATYRLAQRAFELQEYEQARRLADRLVRAEGVVDPEMLASSLYILGQLAIAQEDWVAVDSPLSRLLTETPESRLRLPAEYWLAEAAYRRGEFETSQGRFESLAKKISGRDDAWLGMVSLRRAQLLAQQKHWGEAAGIAASIRESHPGFTQLYEADYLLGRCLAAQAKFNEARQAYQRVTEAEAGQGGKSETAAMSQWMIGESYLHQKDYDAAIRAYLRVPPLYAYPRWQAAALLQAGKCHEYRTEWSKAVQLYERVENEFPNTMFAEQVAERLHIAKERATMKSS